MHLFFYSRRFKEHIRHTHLSAFDTEKFPWAGLGWAGLLHSSGVYRGMMCKRMNGCMYMCGLCACVSGDERMREKAFLAYIDIHTRLQVFDDTRQGFNIS